MMLDELSDAVLDRADPIVSEDEASDLVATLFGMNGRAERLTGERDQNFLVRTAPGERYVLKISHSAEEEAVGDLQTRALLHLAARDATLPVPRLVPARSGGAAAPWRAADGGERTVRLLTFLDGEPLYRRAPTLALLDALGAALARLDRAAADFRHPAESHLLLWDLQQADRVAERIDTVADTEARRHAAAGLNLLAREATPRLAGLRRQFIHNDLNPHNVLVAADGAPRVTGILDLGDAVRAPLVHDVAVAAAYHVGADADWGAVSALIAGYRRVLPLVAEELALIPALIAGRLAMTVVIASWRAALYPGNAAYILRNVPAALAGLDRLLGADTVALARVLDERSVPA